MTATGLPTAKSDKTLQPPSSPDGAAWLNGKTVPISEAKISILDWGFLRSDATYDVIHLWKKKLFRVDDHLDRFFNGMQRLHMDIGMSREQVKQAMIDCVKASNLTDAYVEVICTRGLPEPGSRDPRTCKNQFMVFAIPFVYLLKPEQQGLSVLISDRVRIPPSSFDPKIKNYLWLDMVMGLYEAYDQNAESVLLVDEQGNLCEGPGFNIFVLKGNQLMTPKRGVLEGITRKTVLELGYLADLIVLEADIQPETALDADEVFATSTAGGLMPITRLNGQPVGDGEPGPVTQRLKEAYWALHDDPRYGLPVD